MTTQRTTPSLRNTWEELLATANAPTDRFDPTTLDDLPAPARRFLDRSIPAGAPLSTAVELEMRGRIRLGVWLRFDARQVLVAGAGFVWAPSVGPWFARFEGGDSLSLDGAHMQFRLFGRLLVVDASGPEIDRSAAGRLAAETAVWLPQALTPQAGARWGLLDDDRATVTVPTPAGPIPVELAIDAAGRLTDVRLDRWNSDRTPPGPASFGGPVHDDVVVDGIHIASRGSVGWDHRPDHPDHGFFEYSIRRARFLPEQD